MGKKTVKLFEGPCTVNPKSGSAKIDMSVVVPLIPGGPGAGTSPQPPTKIAVKNRK